MLDDWFRVLELPLSFSEFVRLPRHPAYKYEYFGGRAVLTPRPRSQWATAALEGLPPATATSSLLDGVDVRPLRPGDWAGLPELLAVAFRDVPPFAALSEGDRFKAAEDCLEHTRTGGDGIVIEPACFVADGDATHLEGAIVITLTPARGAHAERRDRPHLTWVMVHPLRFGQGLGSKLLTCAAAALRGLGYLDLASTFLVGNERSARWHWRNGFRLLPDPWSLRSGRTSV